MANADTGQAIAQQLSSILPPEQLIPHQSGTAAWQNILQQSVQGDSQPWTAAPSAVKTLADTMACLHKHQSQVLVAGQGTKLSWGNPSNPIDIVLSTRNLNQLIDHAVGDMTVTLQAGMRFADLQTHLAQHNQWIPLDPSQPHHATVGGILATRDAGALRHRYGGMRDLCLGLTIVRSDGQVAKAGGRVVKNVAGYDLMKLFTGSFGTLGIVADLTLRAYPLPECSGTVLVTGAEDAIATLTHTLLKSTLTPTSVDIVVLGTTPLTLAVQFQSLSESVRAQIDQLHSFAKPLSLTCETLTENDATWWTESAAKVQTGAGLNPIGPTAVLCQIGVLSAHSVTALAQLHRLASQTAVALQGRIHAGSGLGQIYLLGNEPELLKTIGQLRSHCEQTGGYLSVLEAPISLKKKLDVWGYSGTALTAMRKLKERFDPKGLLNTGRFVGGI